MLLVGSQLHAHLFFRIFHKILLYLSLQAQKPNQKKKHPSKERPKRIGFMIKALVEMDDNSFHSRILTINLAMHFNCMNGVYFILPSATL